MKASVRKTYDLRGVYPTELNSVDGYALGRAVAIVLNAETVVVGLDNRSGSKRLYPEVCRGLSESGVVSICLGPCTLDQLTYAVGSVTAGRELPDAGIMLTGGSDDPRVTGLKIIGPEGAALTSHQIEMIRLVTQTLPPNNEGTPTAGCTDHDATEGYRKYMGAVLRGYGVWPPMAFNTKLFKVVIGSGGSEILKALLGALRAAGGRDNITLIPMQANPFSPVMSTPDPQSNTVRRAMKSRIRKTGAQMGLAFNSDGSRMVLYDEKGMMVHPALVGTFLAATVHAKVGKVMQAAVSHDAVYPMMGMSQHLNFPLKLSINGSAPMRSAMRESALAFGADASGRYYFQDMWWSESAVLAACITMQMLYFLDEPVSGMVATCNDTLTLSDEYRFPVHHPKDVLSVLQTELGRAGRTGTARVGDDLVAQDMGMPPLWRAVIRKMDTDACLSLRMEGTFNKDSMQKLLEGFKTSIERADAQCSDIASSRK